MTERVNIANIALGMLGEDPITSLDDETGAARQMKLHYDYVRDAVLEVANWTFARKRFIPAVADDPPEYGWNYAFPLPHDILVLRRVERNYTNERLNQMHFTDPNPVAYELENRVILTDEPNIYCVGTERVEGEGIYSALFVQAFAARLAMVTCLPITESSSKLSTLTALYGGFIKEAKGVDGQQGTGRRFRNTRMQQARRA